VAALAVCASMATLATTTLASAQSVSHAVSMHPHAIKPAVTGRLGVAPRVVTPHMTIVVDTQADVGSPNCGAHHPHGSCSLRGAINRADSDSGHYDAVVIPAHFHITLTQNTVLYVYNSMEIVGGVGSFVSGGFTTEVFDVYSNAAVTITGLRIQDGNSFEGGGIYCSNAALVLGGDAIVGNTASYGGGLYASGGCNVWIDSSVFASNNVGSGSGGGAYIYDSASITRSTFGGANPSAGNIGRYGAGLYEYDGTLTVSGSTFTHNTSTTNYGEGVGLYNDEEADITNSNFTYNTSAGGGDGAGIYNSYLMHLVNSNVSYNSITGSSSAYGAGLYDDGTLAQLRGVNFIGNSSRVTGSDVYGGAVVTYSSVFDWTGGQIIGTVNGKVGTSTYIEGGAILSEASNGHIAGVTIKTTINHSLPGEGIEGGVIYNDDYTHFTGINVAGTSNSGYYVEGGVFYNTSYANVNGLSAAGTVNQAAWSDGGYVEGGGFYNDSDLVATGLTFNGTANVASVVGHTPSTWESYIEGGVFCNFSDAQIDHLMINGVNSHASGGSGYIEGGVLYSDELLILHDSQMLGATVTADYYAEGGLFYNSSYSTVNNLTIGASTVHVLGSAVQTSPYGEGTLVYNDSKMSWTNVTVANDAALLAGHGTYNWALENFSTWTITNNTFANDSLGGPGSRLLWADTSSVMYLRNTIVASNIASLNCGVPGLIRSTGFNIDSGGGCHFLSAGDFQGTAPKVMGLANNGGTIDTAAIVVPSSPALNHGSNAGCPSTDARGVPRPQHGVCDIGAYEAVYK
jgi:hypothetical protein